MQEYIVVYEENRVEGYDSEAAAKLGILADNDMQAEEKAKEAGINLDKADRDERYELDAEAGDEPKAYMTVNIMDELKHGSYEEDGKKKLMKELKKEQIEFTLSETILSDILDNVDPVSIN